jgi:hypothetical protein
MKALADPSLVKDRDHKNILPYLRKVTSSENRVENLGEE